MAVAFRLSSSAIILSCSTSPLIASMWLLTASTRSVVSWMLVSRSSSCRPLLVRLRLKHMTGPHFTHWDTVYSRDVTKFEFKSERFSTLSTFTKSDIHTIASRVFKEFESVVLHRFNFTAEATHTVELGWQFSTKKFCEFRVAFCQILQIATANHCYLRDRQSTVNR